MKITRKNYKMTVNGHDINYLNTYSTDILYFARQIAIEVIGSSECDITTKGKYLFCNGVELQDVNLKIHVRSKLSEIKAEIKRFSTEIVKSYNEMRKLDFDCEIIVMQGGV